MTSSVDARGGVDIELHLYGVDAAKSDIPSSAARRLKSRVGVRVGVGSGDFDGIVAATGDLTSSATLRTSRVGARSARDRNERR